MTEQPPPPRIFTVEFGQDDPSKCTSAKMRRFRLARQVRLGAIPRGALVLNPLASESVSARDKQAAEREGIVVIDCSWEKAGAVLSRRLRGLQRRLPILLAGNPTNYSVARRLSSVEAVAATSYIVGYREFSRRLLSLYKWGETFLTLNASPLDEYSAAESQERIRQIEGEYFPQLV